MSVTGKCLCGSIEWEAEASPISVHYCHCTMCRRQTGSAFAVLAWWPINAIRWIGREPRMVRSSPIARRGFCGRCGSPISLRYDPPHSSAGKIAIHLGSFDAPEVFAPSRSYGVESSLSWVECGRDLPEEVTRETW